MFPIHICFFSICNKNKNPMNAHLIQLNHHIYPLSRHHCRILEVSVFISIFYISHIWANVLWLSGQYALGVDWLQILDYSTGPTFNWHSIMAPKDLNPEPGLDFPRCWLGEVKVPVKMWHNDPDFSSLPLIITTPAVNCHDRLSLSHHWSKSMRNCLELCSVTRNWFSLRCSAHPNAGQRRRKRIMPGLALHGRVRSSIDLWWTQK